MKIFRLKLFQGLMLLKFSSRRVHTIFFTIVSKELYNNLIMDQDNPIKHSIQSKRLNQYPKSAKKPFDTKNKVKTFYLIRSLEN